MRRITLGLACTLLASCGGGGDPTDKTEADESSPRAHRLEWHDPVGDLWGVRYNVQYFGTKPRPQSQAMDITGASVSHEARELVIALQFKDLWPLEDDESHLPIQGQIVTNTGTRWNLSLWAERHVVYANVEPASSGNECRRVRADVDDGSDMATLHVARSCIGVPKWVRVNLAAITLPGRDQFGDSAMGPDFPAARRDQPFTEPIYVAPRAAKSNTAAASKILIRDPRGDVESTGRNGLVYRPDPTQQHGDILSTELGFVEDDVVLRVEFAVPPELAGRSYDFWAYLKSEVGVWALDDDLRGDPILRVGKDIDAVSARCDDLRRSIDPTSAVVTWSVAQSCLGGPQWLSVSPKLMTELDTGASPVLGVSTFDDAQRPGYGGNGRDLYSQRVFAP